MPPTRRRVSGPLATGAFLRGAVEQARIESTLVVQYVGSLVKLHDGHQPTVHFELWLHHARGRVELGLHFETRDAARNQCLLEFVADELLFLKAALGNGLEAEPWEKGWTRLYLTRPIERLDPEQQAVLAREFGHFVEVLEPLRRDALESCP